MKLPFLASFLLLIGVLYIRIRISNKNIEKSEAEFWERERKANSTRKKSLDYLDYIHIPPEFLAIKNPTNSIVLAEGLKTLQMLSRVPIVNLNGISNTDLKLTYGTANISVLTEYDNHYTQLATTLQDLAEVLYKEGRREECMRLLEFAISTRTDISKTYYLLASLYKEFKTPEKISSLITIAETTRSVLKPTIVRTLKESYQ